MSHKAVRISYWIITGLFCAFMIVDGAVKLLQPVQATEIMVHLGYPNYVLTILGIGNILGALALLQPWDRRLTEWAYAGFAFHFIGAFLSRAFVHDSADLMVSPLIFLAIMFASYILWKKRHKTLINLSVNI